MPGSAIGYVRVSSDDQVKGRSLDEQERALRDWCAREGVALVEIFREEGKTARSRDRSELGRALAYAKAHATALRYFVVDDLSRLARDVVDQLSIMRELGALGVETATVMLRLTNDAHGRAVAGYVGVTNQFQSDLQAEKIARSMLAAKREGRWPHAAPIGYRNGRGPSGEKTIELDETVAPVLRDAFERAARGESPAEILAALEARGLRGRNGKRIRPQELRKILRSPFYAGRVRSDRHGFEVEGRHEALVTHDLWLSVRARLDGRAPAPAPARSAKHQDFPLRGFVYCARCGRPLTAGWSRGRSGARFAYYWCWSRDCSAGTVRREALDRAFVEALASIELDEVTLELVEAALRDLWEEARAESSNARRRAARELEQLQERRERLVEAYVFEKSIDRPTYDRLLAKLDDEIERADFEHLRARADLGDVAELLAFARPMLTGVSDLWSSSSPDLKRRIQRLAFPEGVRFAAGALSTPSKALIYSALGANSGEEKGMVEHFRGGLNTLGAWLSDAGGVALEAAA